MNDKILIVSLGGSIIVPKEVDVDFLTGFIKLINKHLQRFKKIVIVCGGGYTSRQYQQAARLTAKVSGDDLDWLGIYSARLNGLLLKILFGKRAYPELIVDPREKIKTPKKVIVASGWQPGWSSDYVATLLAKLYGSRTVINLSNIEYVYDKDPRKFKDARPLKKISWPDFRKMIGGKWIPGASFPFDPVASRLAQASHMQVYVMNGRDLKNLGRFLRGTGFKGTLIK